MLNALLVKTPLMYNSAGYLMGVVKEGELEK